jgi:hypothetical protein
MANAFVTPTWVMRQVARIAVNNLKFAGRITRYGEDKFRAGGVKVGDTVQARLPQRFVTTYGQGFQPQAINDQTVPVTITDQLNIGTSYSTFDTTLTVQDAISRYAKPAGEQLANTIDYLGLSRLFLDVYFSVGTPGTTPTDNETYLDAGTKLTDAACPMDGRIAVLNPRGMAKLSNANQALFNPTRFQSENFRNGQFAGQALGIDEWFQDQNVARFTVSTYAGSTPLVDGANQTGSSVLTNGWASGATTLNKGQVFTIDGVYQVNPQNYQSTGSLQQFVVTQTISDTTGAITISISPSIITSGQLQTVTASPANDAAINLVGASATANTAQSLVFHPEAFIMAMAPLDKDLPGARVTQVTDSQMGVSFRHVEQYNGMTDQKINRIDGIVGYKTFRADWACRVQGL